MFEYDEVLWTVEKGGQRASSDFATFLNNRAEDGWELFESETIISEPTMKGGFRTTRRVLFRRPLDTPPPETPDEQPAEEPEPADEPPQILHS